MLGVSLSSSMIMSCVCAVHFLILTPVCMKRYIACGGKLVMILTKKTG